MPERRVLYRVDPRLVHATLMNAWVPATGIERIIIADQHVAADQRQRTILEMSAMDAARVFFTTEAEASKTVQKVVAEGAAIVLFTSLESALAAIKHGLDVDRLIIGHLPQTGDRLQVHPAVHLGPSDHEVITAIENKGVEVAVQPLPDEPPRTRTGDIEPVRQDVESSAPMAPASSEARAVCEVVNERGLHLRAAHVLASLAGRIEADVFVGRDGVEVNAKSLLGLTTLGAACGTKLDVIVRGPDADAALKTLVDLFASGFDEGTT